MQQILTSQRPIPRRVRLTILVTTLLVLGVGIARPAAPTSTILNLVEEPLLSFPTGSAVMFGKSIKAPTIESDGAVVVYLRKENSFDLRIWQVKGVLLPRANKDESRESEHAVSFVIPQLERGRYDAWYGAEDPPKATDSMKFEVVPYLIADEGIKRGVPDSSLEVRVRIFSPTVFRKGQKTPERVNIPVAVDSSDPSIAEPTSPRSINTDANGYATWKIQIKNPGIAQLKASAEGFEPAIVEVIGMPATGATYAEAALAFFTERAKKSEQSAAKAEGDAKSLDAEMRVLEMARSKGSGAKSVTKEQAGIIERGTVSTREAKANQIAIQQRLRANSDRAAVEAWITILNAQPPRLGDRELKPGDILLVLGNSFVSETIRKFEENQLGGPASYSHASLYLGEIKGVKMVAEMWSTGFWITPLQVSVKGSRLVDVYRWPSIDEMKRQELARRSASALGDPNRFIRFENPSFFSAGSILPYAFEEIMVLTLASSGSPGLIITRALNNYVDPRAGGRRKMICSELVAWSYHDSGLELDVSYWKTLSDLNIFTNDDRRRDYTTPNMLARSKSLTLVGRYLGP